MFFSTFLFFFKKKNLILWRLCTSVQILSSCLTPGFSLSISHSSRCKVFLQVLNMSNPCRSVCFYHVVYVVITDGSTSLSILLCTSFYFECCQTLCEQNAFFFFFSLPRYCSNKVNSNEKQICFSAISSVQEEEKQRLSTAQ